MTTYEPRPNSVQQFQLSFDTRPGSMALERLPDGIVQIGVSIALGDDELLNDFTPASVSVDLYTRRQTRFGAAPVFWQVLPVLDLGLGREVLAGFRVNVGGEPLERAVIALWQMTYTVIL